MNLTKINVKLATNPKIDIAKLGSSLFEID